ncbi:hypothetical protein TL16_g08569 [Triparma laevis f. inornata]|uniref:Cytidyltransferase-like domain-containing protein n=1 Tax=Triparma laevis f. inornata TaxID=1714386 RepID=A0A9W7B3L5_9STRA|nr:hypothetical protein TL16_g08569 [Triparma laevis f. inornata]
MSEAPSPTTTLPKGIKTVFVSGCYDILHAGHLTFFNQAKSLGDHLTVSFASEEVLLKHKNRRPSIPDDHKASLLSNLRMVDNVIIGNNCVKLGLDFYDFFLEFKPSVLAVTADDKYGDVKRALCEKTGTKYVVLDKTPPSFSPVSTSSILASIKAPEYLPLRVDFAGGWLDVPRLAREGGFIVNCSVSPLVSLSDWPYNLRGGLGGSGAWAMLQGSGSDNQLGAAVDKELALGVGWQDPAIISETGLVVWKSGVVPGLEVKVDPTAMLEGKMAIYWTGDPHDTPATAKLEKDLDAIETAGKKARDAVWASDYSMLCEAVNMSYKVQLGEGMNDLVASPAGINVKAKKYLGGGFGGYALFLFDSKEERDKIIEHDGFRSVEPYIKK